MTKQSRQSIINELEAIKKQMNTLNARRYVLKRMLGEIDGKKDSIDI